MNYLATNWLEKKRSKKDRALFPKSIKNSISTTIVHCTTHGVSNGVVALMWRTVRCYVYM